MVSRALCGSTLTTAITVSRRRPAVVVVLEKTTIESSSALCTVQVAQLLQRRVLAAGRG